MTVTLIQHVCDYTVDLQKKYKILSDWRYSFVTMVTPLVKKKSVAGVENEEVKQWIQDKDVL